MAHEPNVGSRIQSETTEIENVTSVVLISRPCISHTTAILNCLVKVYMDMMPIKLVQDIG